MVFRLKRNQEELQNRIFLHRQWPTLLVICALVVFGNMYSSGLLLIAAMLCVVIAIFSSDVANAFYWALFLVPNIRMLDPLGVSFLANVMMALPLLVYFLQYGIRKVPAIALIGFFVLLAMELLHDAVLNDMRGLINIGGWALNFMLCFLVTLDPRVGLKSDDTFSAFSTGIIMSAVMCLLSGSASVAEIIDNLNYNARFSAFANDPNYYSLYICLTMACVLNVRGYNIYKFIVLALLTAIGLLTASKMCLLMMAFIFVLLFVQVFNNSRENRGNQKFLLWSTAGMVGLAIAARDYIGVFVENFFRRAGLGENQALDMGQLTSGRSWIMAEYIEILGRNLVCLLFGYGFTYHSYLGQSDGAGAHNTYLDLILSWGIVGVVIFAVIVYLWTKHYRISRNIRKLSAVKLIPLLILLINFVDLSCLAAGMFPFVIAVALIQWLPDHNTEEIQKEGAL